MSSLSASIIVPVFNDQQNLNACLAALAEQDFCHDHFEVLVVDNGFCPKLTLPDFPNLTMHLLHCDRPGSYAARNAGLRMASGEVLVFLDVDCHPCTHWLASGLEALHEAPAKTIVGGEVVFESSENPAATELFQSIKFPGQQYHIEKEGFSGTSNLFVRAEHMLKIGEFSEVLLSGGDKEWCWRAIEQGFGLAFSSRAVVTSYYRQSLAALVIRIRRIAGGRYYMKKRMDINQSAIGGSSQSSSNSFDGLVYILSQNDLSLIDRCRVISIAVVLKVVELAEALRLRAGFSAERR